MASIDRLSSLPEGIICHILSFLPTKRSVATSVLGKRWRFLWAHVPCLEFSGYDFRKEDFGEEETQSWDDFMKEATQASNIIHGVILRHKAKRMDSLTLDHVYCDEDQLETWIKTAIDRGVRNLHLELDFDTIPQSLFNCKTIVDLKLDKIRMSLSDVGNVSLPSLKKFYVYNLISENDDVLPRFLSGCPSLEELNMVFTFREENDYVGCKNISSPKIKTLKLNLVDLFCPWQPEYRMIINAPALRYLQVHGYDLECITIPITMISLVEADIRLANYWLSNLKTTVVKFFHSLCYVKCLKISCWKFGEFIHRGVACSILKLDNLTKLELRLDFEWSLLVKFLEVADNLQVLTVDFNKGDSCPEPEQAPKCLLSCLKTITIKSMRFKEHEFDMVRYLLRNSRVLERIEVFTPTYECIDLETKFQALKRISLFQRGSSACQLAFLTDSE